MPRPLPNDWKKRWWRNTLKHYPLLADEIFDGPCPAHLTDDDVQAIEQFVDNFELGVGGIDDNVQSAEFMMTETSPVIKRKAR